MSYGDEYYLGAAGTPGAPPRFRFEVITAGADTFQLPLYDGGTYNFYVDWGDGSNSTITTWNAGAANHSYAGAGTYNAVITGILVGWRFNDSGDKTLIGDISEWGNLRIGNTGGAFAGCANLTVSATDKPDLTGLTTLSGVFQYCSSLTVAGAEWAWDVSNILVFSSMFDGCTSVVDVSYLEAWNTGNALAMSGMFRDCTGITSIDLTGWDVSKVDSFSLMFHGCVNLTSVDVTGWNVAHCQNYGGMFQDCDVLASITGLSAWITTGATSFSAMFSGSPSIVGLDISGFKIANLATAAGMMTGAAALTTIVYDATLLAWSAQVDPPNIQVDFSTSTYTGGGAVATARGLLVSNGWTITDGGIAA